MALTCPSGRKSSGADADGDLERDCWRAGRVVVVLLATLGSVGIPLEGLAFMLVLTVSSTWRVLR